MLNPDILWMEPILGDLRGLSWEYDGKTNTLKYDSKSGDYITVDDGQHRRAALEMLNATERGQLSFTLTVTKNLSYERRLGIFRRQRLRMPLDARLNLAQQHRLGEWKNEFDREAYEIVLRLNSDVTSPLRDLILLEEMVKRPHEGRHRPIGINANGLFATIRRLVGSKSPLQVLSASKRSDLIMVTVNLMADVWLRQWKSEQHVLTTARGVNAILRLHTSSPNFSRVVGEDFSQESIRRGLELAASFDWAVSKNLNDSVDKMVQRLDQSIGRNWAKERQP
ncbi:MAG: hypothetical protein O3C23_02950 [bacterium]|nr:hypothetical protein [bacterium]